MSAPTPAGGQPTVQTVLADAHRILDDAKADAQGEVAALQHINVGTVAADAKQLIHDGIEAIKTGLARLVGHDTTSATAETGQAQVPPTV